MSNTVRAENGAEVYEHEIYVALEEYQKENEIENYKCITQNEWTAALMDVCDRVFKNTNKLKCDNYDSNNLMYGGSSNNNAYDLDKINKIFRYYCKLCYTYDKEISITGFSYLTGISKSCFYGWAGNEGYSKGLADRASQAGVDLLQNINDANEESLSGMLVTGKRSPVAVLGALNRKHGWNMGQPQVADQGAKPAMSQEDIRQIADQARKESIPELLEGLPDE